MSESQLNFENTLNLPKTSFEMKAGLAQKEPKQLEAWAKAKLHDKIKAKSKQKKESFILHDGPPYANGNIHIGHALNKIIKDMIVKSQTMQGKNSFYLPGWDCHGLPIEHQLLKEMGKRKSDVEVTSFRKKAHDYAMKYVGIQREQFQRLGVFGEWDNPYLTLNKDYEYWIIKSLGKLSEKGFVYRGLKPVNWCPSCETALAEAEVEYENHTSPTVFVKFKVKNANVLGSFAKPISLLIWTTTPWTLLANVAVAVHPAFTYVVVDIGEELIIVEKTLSIGVLDKAKVTNLKIVQEVSGSDLTKLTYAHPFGMLDDCKVVAADYVTKEDGTGLVHTAPGHGQDDFNTGSKYKLPVLMPVNDKGVYTNAAGEFSGQFVFKANPNIIEALKQKGALLHSEPLQHQYPHCWRCKNPIIFRATHQWFLKIEHNNLRDQLKKVIREEVTWIPAPGRERILGMIETRPDWCLSRQRYWGVPIPAIRLKGQDEQPILNKEVIDNFANIAKAEGSDAWFERPIEDFLPADLRAKADQYEKTYDILDVWFDSGVSHYACREVFDREVGVGKPISMYLEGSDQHRGWFQSSLIPSVAIDGKAPYQSVLTHGFVVDGSGRKMSKSLGNVISPQDIIQKSGADILRLWVASSSYNDDVRISQEILDRLVDGYRKIRNTFRYLLGNLYDFDPDTEQVAYEQLPDLDKWALTCLYNHIDQIQQAYNAYEFAEVYKAIYSLCNDTLSNIYLDILKDRLYISSAQAPERKSAQTVLFHLTNYLVRVAAPILTFTTEEIFSQMPKTKEMKAVESVHLLEWLKLPQEWNNQAITERFARLLELRPVVLKLLEDQRRAGVIGSSNDAKVIFNTASAKDEEYLKSFGVGLADFFVVSQAHINKVAEVKTGASPDFSKTEALADKADGQKCSRSWKYSTDVGSDPDFPTLSLRSAKIVKEIFNASK